MFRYWCLYANVHTLAYKHQYLKLYTFQGKMLEKNGTYILWPKYFLFSLSVKNQGRWAGHVERTGFLARNLKEKGHVEDLGIYGRIILKWI